MALKPCRECQAEVEELATSCPQCEAEAPSLDKDGYARLDTWMSRLSTWTSWFVATASTGRGFLGLIVGLLILTPVVAFTGAVVIMALYYLWPILVLGLVGYLVVRHKRKQASADVTTPRSSSPEPPR